MSIGLPSITIKFQAAAKKTAIRLNSKTVGLILRDAATEAHGIHVLQNMSAIPSSLSETTKKSIERAFLGSDRGSPRLVVVAIIDPADTTGPAVSAALLALENQVLDYVAGPDDVTVAEADLIADWVLDQRKFYRPVKAVLPKNAANDIGIINFDMGDFKVGSSTFTAAQYCGRIAGILAGIPADKSSTYATLREVTEIPAMTIEQQNAAIAAGKLILIHDGIKAKIARGVNSMTAVPMGGKEDWKKIKIVEALDLINYYVRSSIEDEWLGQYANTYDNKLILVTALQNFFFDLEAAGVVEKSYVDIDTEGQRKWLQDRGISTSGMTEQEIREANTGDWVYIVAGGILLDAMEDFQVTFHAEDAGGN